MAEIEKRLRKRDWDRLTEMLGVGNVGYVRFTTAVEDDKGGDHGRRPERKYDSSSVEVALKESSPAAEGVRRMRLAFKEAPVGKGDFFFGWALVSMEKGADGDWKAHEDLDGDTMTDAVLVDAFKGTFGIPQPFYKGHDMDDRTIRGWVGYAPMTRDVQKGLGLEGSLSGLMAMIRVDDPDLRDAIASGELPDISIEAQVGV